jgi:GT2 family glycosyltransferase
MTDRRISVVVLTHDRPAELERTLARLHALPEQPPLIVVDNASAPGSVDAVLRSFPTVERVRCERNLGAAGRNAGVARVRTPCVAFCDDDTWWAPGALRRAADLLDAHPALAAVSARVLVEPSQRTDPTCEHMARSPLGGAGLPGPALIAFMAGAVAMRTAAWREAGGYESKLFLGAEELLLGLDLATRGWRMVYAADVVTHHQPSPAGRDSRGRRVALARNRLWIAWMRLPASTAWHETRRLLHQAAADGMRGTVLCQALAGLPWALARRRAVPPQVDAMFRAVYLSPDSGPARAAQPQAGRP